MKYKFNNHRLIMFFYFIYMFLFLSTTCKAQEDIDIQFIKLKNIYKTYYPNSTFEFDNSDCILYMENYEIQLACTNVEYYAPENEKRYYVMFKCRDGKGCIGDITKSKDRYVDYSNGVSWTSGIGQGFKSSSAAIKFLSEAKKLIILVKEKMICGKK